MKLRQIAIVSKWYTIIHNFNTIPYVYLENTLLKLKRNFSLSFLDILSKEKRENAITKIIYDKHSTFGATNLRQLRQFHTTTGCDGWDI